MTRVRLLFACLIALALGGCGAAGTPTRAGTLAAVGAESQYANVIAQIGGRYVTANSIENNPNTDPHSFEASPGVAQEVANAKLIVQNGLGYDDYMKQIESSTDTPSAHVIDVSRLLGLPESTPNPHLWYAPQTMRLLAPAVARVLSTLMPAHAAYFAANVVRFEASLQPWSRALASLAAAYPGASVATTEPVGDYLLSAAGLRNSTPFSLQADIMNGTDPAPQAIAAQDALFSGRRVRVFVYNQQVTDSLTQSFLTQALSAQIPVVGVYETMPAGYDYQSWMLAETQALRLALADGRSTRTLG